MSWSLEGCLSGEWACVPVVGHLEHVVPGIAVLLFGCRSYRARDHEDEHGGLPRGSRAILDFVPAMPAHPSEISHHLVAILHRAPTASTSSERSGPICHTQVLDVHERSRLRRPSPLLDVLAPLQVTPASYGLDDCPRRELQRTEHHEVPFEGILV